MSESLEDVYQQWWDPQWARPLSALLMRQEPRPHCGLWYDMPAPVPETAQWALVYVGVRPGRIRYAKSKEAARRMFEAIALRDHPHTFLIPITRQYRAALAALLRHHGFRLGGRY